MASAQVTIEVKFVDLVRVRSKYHPSHVTEPLKWTMKKATPLVKKRIVDRSPIETGALKASYRTETSPTQAIAWTDQSNPRTGFPYAAALATGAFTHRHGPFTGSPTTGYPDRAAQDFISQDLEMLGRFLTRAIIKSMGG
jgi:hypothetical protein